MFTTRLHIPLHPKKTVRRKRTVSLYLLFFGGGLFLIWFCARAWIINHSLALAIVPDGTIAAITLSPTQETWPNILEDFGDIPLLSHRPFTLSDIAPYLHGPFSFFFLDGGETAIGFKTTDSLPHTLFQAYGLFLQPYPEKMPAFFLLSTKTQTFITLDQDQKPFFLTPKIGTMTFFTKNTPSFVGSIHFNQKRYRIQTPPSFLETLPKIAWPETIVGAMHVSPSSQTVFPLLSLLPALEDLFHPFSSGILLFAKNDSSFETLLSLKKENLDDTSTILRLFGAIQNPLFKKQSLPDGTQTTEIRIDPSEISIEEIVLTGIPVFRAKTSTRTLFSAKTEQNILFATGEEILSFWLHADKKKKEKDSFECGNNPIGFFKPFDSLNVIFANEQYKQFSPLWPLLKKFDTVSLNKAKKTDDIQFCY